MSDADVQSIANKIYKMDPQSDFTGKRPKQDPAFKVFIANAKAGPQPSTSNKDTKTKDSDVKDPINNFVNDNDINTKLWQLAEQYI